MEFMKSPCDDHSLLWSSLIQRKIVGIIKLRKQRLTHTFFHLLARIIKSNFMCVLPTQKILKWWSISNIGANMNKVMEILNLVMVSQYLILHEITLSTLLTSSFGEKYFMQTKTISIGQCNALRKKYIWSLTEDIAMEILINQDAHSFNTLGYFETSRRRYRESIEQKR